MIAFVKRYAGFFLLLLSLGGLVFLNVGSRAEADVAVVRTTTTIQATTTASTTAVTTSTMGPRLCAVDVIGAVLHPGRYILSETATVADAIALAGGAAATADLSAVNLAKALYDGMVVAVPAAAAAPITYVYVDVKGAVRFPGVYRVETGKRVVDAVLLAGGFTADADASNINLAVTVRDEMMIVIPFVSSVSDPDGEDPEEIDVNAGKVNINTATVEELDVLYGIGYILAQRIIDYRAEYGAFETIEDIMKVDGIKESVYEAIKDDICV